MDGPRFAIDGTDLCLLAEAEAQRAALLALIAGARRTLRLLYYIYADDGTGIAVRDALIAAAARGVRVWLLVDGFGSADTADDFFAPLQAAGGRICRFLPRFGRRYLLRNHQKMAIADEGQALIGGFNIADAYFAGPEADGWRDFGAVVAGRPVRYLARYFDAVFGWAALPRAPIGRLRRIIRRYSQRRGRVRWVMGGPTRRLSPWARAVAHDIQHGRRLDLIAAYFAPNFGLLRRIGRLARRHGAVRIVTAARSDNATTIAAARHTYRRLLRRGARVFEYQPARLHTKLFVIDDIVYLGSANCDMRSLYLNCELMLRIEDGALAAHLRGYVDGEVAASREARLDLLRARAGWWTRLRWSLAYFLVAIVDFTVTRRLNLAAGSDAIAD